ncbi:hypothetical protein EWM64_g1061 [Hericium alpestre]|uniref:DNA-directed RNA polymerase, mitochondrial n=1 Tax=Hericium alpestre TaxID=135208 RepID=A0A4Z0ABH3_9AGAM|nr:hypothetical protein EWM64_g1061 [Hericium alpestre]
MIPLSRRSASKNVETTLLSYSRQRLPRPARLFYSTPSKRNSAPASAPAASAPVVTDLPPSFLNGKDTGASDMNSFLRGQASYTIVPTPLPDDRSSKENDMYFTDTATQDLLSVMDACLQGLYDVPRAKTIFDDLRERKKGDPNLSVRLYNQFLQAYIEMASTKDIKKRALWIEDAWTLFEVLESGEEKVHPTAMSYALALVMWSRFSASDNSLTYIRDMAFKSPNALLRSMMDGQISVSQVIASRGISNSEEAETLMKALSSAAMDMNLLHVVQELGEADALGRTEPDALDEIPEVMPVRVPERLNKAGEVETGPLDPSKPAPNTIPFNLDNLRKYLAQFNLARRVLPDDVSARQRVLEESVHDEAVERLRYMAEKLDDLGIDGPELNSRGLQKWMWTWHQKLKERLKEDIAELVEEEKYNTSRQRTTYRLSPFLSLLKPEKLSLMVILEIMRLHGSGGVSDGMKTARALLTVGKAVEIEYKAQMCRKNKIAVPSNVGAMPGYFSRLSYRDLHARRVAAFKYSEDAEDWTAEWTQTTKVKVGSFLVDRLMEVALVDRTAVNKRTGEEVTEEHPAFFHSYEYVRGHKLGVIKLNPVVAARMAKDGLRETLHPRHLPMLVKPKPWLGPNDGGYIYNKLRIAPVMRFKESKEQQAYLKRAAELGNVELVFAGLDVLGATPWKINRRLFDVVLEVWNRGERMGKLPPAVYDVPEPEKPENVDTDPAARNVFLTRQRAWLQERANTHSDRCSVNYKIEIARTFLNDTLYMPHNLDFRGRAYPIPPHLNHIGDDLSRGLLLFAESKPLGEHGLRWLKIHLANLYGYDKATFEERAEFVHQHLEDVFDSAENPLSGKRWWSKADDPWQCLATCMELKSALDSPTRSHTSVHCRCTRTGTCNGLQHYAALGGDARGAKQVNLDVADRPSDVYTYVANMVEKSMLEDVEKGDKFAMLLTGKIARKVVKQTVMTTVYGVTFIGAREQIQKQLKDRGDIEEEQIYMASIYLAKKVMQCIGDLFTGAQAIQDYLTTAARLIAKSVPGDRLDEVMKLRKQPKLKTSHKPPANRLQKEQMTSVVWTTPLGLPIVQPYRKIKRKQIVTSVQSVYISDPNTPSEVNAQKQATAFPPNFIHSLDATHMLLTALECRTQSLTFASVHDSYWTHPSTIDQMSAIIRDTFIALHSSDVLRRLDAEFRERYKGYKVPAAALRTVTFLRSPELEKAIEEGKLDPEAEVLADEAAETSLVTTISREELRVLLASDARRRKAKGKVLREDEDEDVEEDEAEEGARSSLKDKFVNLTDVLPELPKKGEFDVNKIKKSLYFFS